MKNKEYKKGIATGVLFTVIVAGGAKIAGNFLDTCVLSDDSLVTKL